MKKIGLIILVVLIFGIFSGIVASEFKLSEIKNEEIDFETIESDFILGESNGNEILLKSRHFVPQRGISEIARNKIIDRAPEETHVLIQFNYIPNNEEKEELKKEGIELLAYIPRKSWFASVSNADIISNFPNIRAITEILSEDKISPAVRNKNYVKNGDGTINVSIQFFNDVDLDEAAFEIQTYGDVFEKFPSINGLKLNTQEQSVFWLPSSDR